ncbi:cytochrome P450 [Streptomyces yaizuensis]|uniref:Cytochrome P450 n=1 Tax=Streptomyces yaizuensis TaxID=2989713 RepID=A0ABQ5P2G9_9ACTN|nr:cytochrome P450 [Streptomyces sp. YSPA8]GLF96807.1 cytochrome P450 [Streptomyces sp. YSPA8]
MTMAETAFTRAVAPGALPLLGHALRLLRDPLPFVSCLASHGDLVEIRLGPQRVYMVCHPELLQRVLTDDRTFDKGGPLFDRLRDFMGNGLATCPHADHRRQRRLAQHAFHHQHMERHGAVMTHQVELMLDQWEDGQVIDAFPVFSAYTLRTVARSLFTADLGDDRVGTIRRTFTDVLAGALPRMLVPDAWQRLPLPGNHRYREANRILTDTVNSVIAQYRQDGTDHGDLMSMLLAARDEDGGGLSDTELRDQVVNLFVAGGETPAAVLSWAVAELAAHRGAERLLYEETDRVLAGRVATWHDLPRLPHTTRIIHETLRRYPGALMITRAASRPAQLAGDPLPAGSVIGFSPLILQSRPDYFPAPERFDPDRWLPEHALAMPRAAFAPFGGGPRKCIGDTFAMAEMTLALASIAARWTWRTTKPTDLRPALSPAAVRPRRVSLQLTARTPARTPPTGN